MKIKNSIHQLSIDPLLILGSVTLICTITLFVERHFRNATNENYSDGKHKYLYVDVFSNENGLVKKYEGNTIRVYRKPEFYIGLAINTKTPDKGYFEFWNATAFHKALDTKGDYPTLFVKSDDDPKNNFWLPLIHKDEKIIVCRKDKLGIYDWNNQYQIISIQNGKFWITSKLGSKGSDTLYYLDDKQRKRMLKIKG
jgi:hypothetical protein